MEDKTKRRIRAVTWNLLAAVLVTLYVLGLLDGTAHTIGGMVIIFYGVLGILACIVCEVLVRSLKSVNDGLQGNKIVDATDFSSVRASMENAWFRWFTKASSYYLITVGFMSMMPIGIFVGTVEALSAIVAYRMKQEVKRYDKANQPKEKECTQ